MTLLKWLSAAVASAALVALPGASVRAQDPGQDDALNRLLEKVGGSKDEPAPDRDAPAKKKEAPDNSARKPGDKEKAPDAEPAKDQAKGKDKEGKEKEAKDKEPKDEVAPQDEGIDNLLKKLGESEEAPTTTGRPSENPDEPAVSPDGKRRPPSEQLEGQDKKTDEHLEKILGRKKKNKDQQQQDGEDNGPLSEAIKKMREVEERLGKSDTGKDTQKKEEQVVKDLDQLLEMIRSGQLDTKGGRVVLRRVRQAGLPRPGQPGQQPGTTGGQAPYTKPSPPTRKDRPSIAGAKDIWGDLPPQVREEMENIAKEAPLASREEIIRQYFLSVAKKSQAREKQ